MSDVRNVIIIGSGPAGYTAAVYASRANLHPLLIEGSVTAGGALMNTTEVENFPGFRDGIMGPDLMEEHARPGRAVRRRDRHRRRDRGRAHGEVKTVTTGEGTVHRAHAVILAMGSAYRELGLPDEKQLSGRGVSWCATCDGFFFRDQDIAVVGGGDSAIEEATFLTKFARSVTIVHRREALRASKIMAERAFSNHKIRFAWNSKVTAIHGDEQLSGVTLRDTVPARSASSPSPASSSRSATTPATSCSATSSTGRGRLRRRRRHAPTTAPAMPGVFACGDLVDHTYRQAITAAGSGCAAALDAEHYLAPLEDPERRRRGGGAGRGDGRAVADGHRRCQRVASTQTLPQPTQPSGIPKKESPWP